jgi:hypothetical protein
MCPARIELCEYCSKITETTALHRIECEHLYADMHCHGGALHWMSAFHAFCSEWLYAVPPPPRFAIHFGRCCALLLQEFHHWHAFPVPGNSYQFSGKQRLNGSVCLVNMYVHPLRWLLFGFNILQMKPRICHLLLIWCDWETHCHLYGIA